MNLSDLYLLYWQFFECVCKLMSFVICEILKVMECFEVILFVGGLFVFVMFLVECMCVVVDCVLCDVLVVVFQYSVIEGYLLLCEWIVECYSVCVLQVLIMIGLQ